MLNLDIIAALINARANKALKDMLRGDFTVSRNESVVSAALETVPFKVYDRANTLAFHSEAHVR